MKWAGTLNKWTQVENTANRFFCYLCGLLKVFIFMTGLPLLWPLIDKMVCTSYLSEKSTPYGQYIWNVSAFLVDFPSLFLFSCYPCNILGHWFSNTWENQFSVLHSKIRRPYMPRAVKRVQYSSREDRKSTGSCTRVMRWRFEQRKQVTSK